MPLAILATIVFIGGDGLFLVIRQMTPGSFVKVGPLLWVFLILAISQAVTVFFLNLHIRLRYGRYLAELKAVVVDLETEEV